MRRRGPLRGEGGHDDDDDDTTYGVADVDGWTDAHDWVASVEKRSHGARGERSISMINWD